MLGLPSSTEVKRPLPKAQLFKRFDWTASQRERFDAEVSRLDFVNWISLFRVSQTDYSASVFYKKLGMR